MRMEILNKFVDIINGAKNQTLAIMMSESLRSSAWRKNVITGYEYVDQDGNVVDLTIFLKIQMKILMKKKMKRAVKKVKQRRNKKLEKERYIQCRLLLDRIYLTKLILL